MLRIGTSGMAGSADVVICGWRDDGPGGRQTGRSRRRDGRRRPAGGPVRTGVKLVFEAGGVLPDLPGLRVGDLPVRGAEAITRALCEGFDVVVAEPGDPAAPVVAAGMWHYGWTAAADPGPLAGATVAGLALAAQRAPCVLEIGRDGGATLDGDVDATAVAALLATRSGAGRHRTPMVTVLLDSVRVTQESSSRIRIAPCAGEPVYLPKPPRVQSV
jgi:hypothetical protein